MKTNWGWSRYMTNVNSSSTLNLKPLITSVSSLPVGNFMYSLSLLLIALHVSCTITQTVERATPNRWPIVLYSPGVARHHRVTATQCFTQTHCGVSPFKKGSSFTANKQKLHEHLLTNHCQRISSWPHSHHVFEIRNITHESWNKSTHNQCSTH